MPWAGTFIAKCHKKPATDTRKVGITQAKWRSLTSSAQTVAAARLMIAQQVLADPEMIFDGWDRPHTDGCCIYVSRPKRDYRKLEDGKITIDVPANPQFPFFLVFVTEDGTVDEWTWREAMDSDPTLPKGVEGKIIWPL